MANLGVAVKPSDQVQPKVRPRADGGFYISWFDNDPNGNPPYGYDVFLQSLDANGVAQWAAGGIRIADLGKSPQDGFSEYQGYPPVQDTRPRWGDYSQAIFVPSANGGGQGGVIFSTEYIQSPNCSDSAFLSDLTCGGTRAPAANWGTSINFLSVQGSQG